MHNWSVDEEKFKKEAPEKYEKWRLEQLINYGLNGEKLSRKALLKYWNVLEIDPAKRRFLAFLLKDDLKAVAKVGFFRRIFCVWACRLCPQC